jgi:hypothetical protein
MPNAVNITNITPPRVQMVDPNTGLVSREWFRFFESLFRLTGSGQNDFTLQDLQLGPDAGTDMGIAVLQTEIQNLSVSPPYTPQLPRRRYGSFYDTTTQTAAAINTAYAMTFNTVDLSSGVTRGTPTSRIYVDTLNVYNVQFSAQVDKTSGGVGLVWIWLRKNGVNVPDSAGQIRIQGNNAEVLAAWNYIIQLNAGDYIELMWEVDDTSVILLAEAASAVHPSIPSIILTVTNNISSDGSY